jgi:formylglycine-generating enzyme
LTEKSRAAGDLPKEWESRLPTEAQWEYACRAGTTTATSFGDTLSSKQANFQGKPYNGAEDGPSLKRAARVGSCSANPWGVHDMHGNVFEWCRDGDHAKLPGGVDPDLYSTRTTSLFSRTGSVSRMRRGGCWADEGWPCRSAFRAPFEPERRSDHIGVRVVAVRL